jgi:putative ABC transport system permease protein
MRSVASRVKPAATAVGRRAAAFWETAAGTGVAASAALSVLMLAGVFIAIAVPRASLDYRTQVLQRIFRTASSTQTAVLAGADLGGPGQKVLGAPQLSAAGAKLAAGLRRTDLPLAPAAAQWGGLTAAAGPFTGAPKPPPGSMAAPQLDLMYRSALSTNATLVAGSPPTRLQSATQGGGASGSGAFQIAVTEATAARLGLHVGSRLQVSGQALVVSGIIRPVGAASSFWTVDPNAVAPLLTYPSPDSDPFLSTAAFVGAGELQALQTRFDNASVTAEWSFPLNLAGISADQAAGLLHALQRVSYLPALGPASTGMTTPNASNPLVISLSSGLVSTLAPVVATDAEVQRALSLLFVSLAAIAAVVLLLGARLVAEHRWQEFAMMRARGASLAQVAAVALRGGALAVLPAAVAAATAAVAVTPGPASSLAWWLAALITGTALTGPPLLAVWWLWTRRDAAPARATRRRIETARRWVADGTLVCACVTGLVILRQQGLPPPGSVDLFTSLAPVLAAIPIALLVIRSYPLLLARLARLARRRRGVVMIVGVARGSAAAQATVLPAFALIIAVAVVGFAAMARAGVSTADVAASWQATQADAVITAPATGPGLTPAAQRRIAGVPGAQRVAAVTVTTGTSGQGFLLAAVIVDPRQYAALTAATPVPRLPATALARRGRGSAGAVPALVSPAALAILGKSGELSVAGRELRLRVADHLAGIVGAPAGNQFVVLPRWAFGSAPPQPTVIAIDGPRLDAAALARAVRQSVPGAQITLRSRSLAAISGAPLPHGGFVTFAQSAAAAGTFGLLALFLMLLLGARSREMTLARLVTMGLDPGQSRRITVVETLPTIGVAVVGGTACALALVPLVGPAVDLAAFTGGPVTVPLHADPLALGAAAAGLLLLAGVTLAVQDWLARRRGVTGALRVGE